LRRMSRILFERLTQTTAGAAEVELVERKGLGHPDSLCDAIANHASVALCREYQKVFGKVLHHNLDKIMLVAGTSLPGVGGGAVEKPMRLVLGDRALSAYKGKTIDVREIVVQSAREWVRQHLRFVDPERHMSFQCEIQTGSPGLLDLFERECVGANDTSFAAGFAPLSRTESLVLSLERHLNSPKFKRQFPESGEDIKVMAVRQQRELHLTLAMAFVDRFVASSKAYFEHKETIRNYVLKYAREMAPDFSGIRVELNTLDDPRRPDGMYLTVLGTSAEGADSGQVGRGNRANGLISLNRPQSIEAHAGKNPVNHVGKIYSYFAHHAARQIYSSVDGVEEAYVHLCSQIGRPIDDPLLAAVKVVLKPGCSLNDVQRRAEAVLREELTHMDDFRKLLTSVDFYARWENELELHAECFTS
jgi:S-adenosylmethionine synthetase